MNWRCRLLLLALVYVVTHAFFSLSSLHSVSFDRRGMVGKDLSDGPLVQREPPQRKKPLHPKTAVEKKEKAGVEGVEEERAAFHTITVPRLHLPRLPIAFINTLTKKARALVPHSPDRQLLFTMVNEAYIKLTLNWFCNVAVLDSSIQNRTLIVGTSPRVCQLLSRKWVRVTCLPLSLGADFDESLSWGRQAYVHLLTLRSQIMLHLIKADVPFVLFETDAVWFRNPSPIFYNLTQIEDADLVLPLKGYPEKGLTLAFDPLYVRPTEAAKELLTELVRRLLEDPNLFDQDVLDALCKRQWRGVVCRTLDWETIADGKWFKLSERERLSFHPSVINNNYYVGPENKAARQAINGLWFLTKTDECMKDKVKKALSKYR